jgi:tetratricopeptide (TPR) repeat protein
MQESKFNRGGITMELKSKLVELVERASAEEQALFAKLSEDERSTPGLPDRWGPKDVIAHLAGWNARLAENLAAAASGGKLERYDDYLAVNAREFAEYQHRPWPEVLARAADARRQLIEQTRARSEAELRGTQTFPWQGDRPLWRHIVGNGFVHPIMHLASLLVERGEQAYATELQEQAARLLGEMDESKDWQGVVRYNLACHYALIGETDSAIEKLAQAFELNPMLIQESKQDSDLVSIRDEPGYRALCPESGV